jgi:HSP20 family molecular chaperone IbpA
MTIENLNAKPAAETDGAEHTRTGTFYRPPVDIVEGKDELTLWADVPGTAPGDVDVKFEDGTLTIHAKVNPRYEEGTEFLVSEYGVGDYWRTFQIGETIDASKISAEYGAGVLTLHLPKTEAIKPRKINVQTA